MSKGEKNDIVRHHLAMVGLSEAAEKKPTQISGGMKQRVSRAAHWVVCMFFYRDIAPIGANSRMCLSPAIVRRTMKSVPL